MNIEDKEQETQVDIDMEAATAEISSGLFGGEKVIGESEGAETPSEGEGEEAGQVVAEDETGASPPQSADGEENKEEENSEEVQALGAPSTWTKEALAKWATIDPVVQQEILKREEDMHRGIEGYKAAAEMGGKVSAILEPYAPILAAENIDPFQMLQSFAGNHYLLSRGTPEQKIQLAANLLTSYNIPLAPLLNYLAESEDPVEPDPQILALRKELDELKGARTQEMSRAQAAAMEHISKEIDAFAADKTNNPYFDELAADIQQLFATGQASNLREAYDKAVWNNPVIRQKEIDRLTAEKQSAAEQEEKERSKKKASAQADKLQVGDKPRDGTVIAGSIDDTLHETMERISARG